MWGQRKCGGIVSHDVRRCFLKFDVKIVPTRACVEPVWALQREPVLWEIDRTGRGGRKPPNKSV